MALALLIFGIFSGSLLAVLVGLIGSHRRIGFGWTFLLSVIFTPLVGLIVALLSDRLPDSSRHWGCLGAVLGFTAIIFIAFAIAILLGLVVM